MTTTDRTGADTATFEARMAELDRLEVADPFRDALADALIEPTYRWYNAGARGRIADVLLEEVVTPELNRLRAELAVASEALRRVHAVADELEERYINGDGKPITNERQAGKCAGYSLAAMKIRDAAAIAALKPAPGTDENGCPAERHHGVDCPGDACRFAAPGTDSDTTTTAEFHAEGDAMTFAVNPPPGSLITVMADDARLLLSINADGTVDGSVEDASEAAGIFVREIRRLIQQPPAPGTDDEPFFCYRMGQTCTGVCPGCPPAPGTDSSGQVVVDVLRNGEHVATLGVFSGSVSVDSSGQAVQRVLDLADELRREADEVLARYPGNPLMDAPIVRDMRASARTVAFTADRICDAVAGPQRDHGGEGGR